MPSREVEVGDGELRLEVVGHGRSRGTDLGGVLPGEPLEQGDLRESRDGGMVPGVLGDRRAVLLDRGGEVPPLDRVEGLLVMRGQRSLDRLRPAIGRSGIRIGVGRLRDPRDAVLRGGGENLIEDGPGLGLRKLALVERERSTSDDGGDGGRRDHLERLHELGVRCRVHSGEHEPARVTADDALEDGRGVPRMELDDDRDGAGELEELAETGVVGVDREGGDVDAAGRRDRGGRSRRLPHERREIDRPPQAGGRDVAHEYSLAAMSPDAQPMSWIFRLLVEGGR